MKSSIIYLFFSVAILLVPLTAQAFVVSSGDQRIPLDPHLSYYEDPTGKLSLNDIVARQKRGGFTQNGPEVLNFGFSDSVFWVKTTFRFSEELGSTKNWILSLDYAPLEDIELFVQSNGQFKKVVSGTRHPFDSRPIEYRNFVYPIDNLGRSEYEVWLRVHSDSSVQIPLSLWSAERFFEYETFSSYGWGLFFGILMALGLYNFFLFVSVKDKAYLYYVLYLIGLSGVILFLNGQGFQWLWKNNQSWNQYALLTFTCFAVFWALQFCRAFLRTHKLIPQFDRFILGMMALSVVVGVLGTTGIEYSSPKLAGGVAGLFTLVAMGAGIVALNKGSQTAPYFLMAWTFFLCGILTYLSSVFGIMPSTWVTDSAMQIGAAAEVTLLSFGLAQRIKIERKQHYDTLASKHQTVLKWQLAEKTLIERASYDTLTKLPNSNVLFKSFERIKTDGAEKGKQFGLVVLHFSRFHEVNKTLGKRNGDRLLIRASDRLAHQAGRIEHVLPIDKTNDYFHFIALLDGVSFGVLVEMNEDLDAPNNVAQKLMDVMSQPIEYEGMLIDIEAIAGIALYPDHGVDIDSLTQQALIALENSRVSAQKISTYSADLNCYSTRRLSLMGDLARAIECDQLELYLQPQVCLDNQEVVGAEALIRWKHENHGFVTPDEFIPLAEQSGLIRPLTAWIIDKVLQYDQAFQRQGVNVRLSVNISAKNIVEKNFVKDTLDKMMYYGTEPARIVYEVTESTMLDNPEKALDVLKNLSALGVQLSIDDFGTGYSSLSYLNRLPVDELKIDRSFVSDMVTNPQNLKIVGMTINLAHTLNLSVVAEGIEDEATLLQLKQLGCDVAQGYFIARPMPVKDFSDWLENQPKLKVRRITTPITRLGE